MNLFIKWYRQATNNKNSWARGNIESSEEEAVRYNSSPYSLRDYDWAIHMQNNREEERE